MTSPLAVCEGSRQKLPPFNFEGVWEIGETKKERRQVVRHTSRTKEGTSLVAQWLRICLPMQGTRVQALVWEDPTCRGATKPESHNY